MDKAMHLYFWLGVLLAPLIWTGVSWIVVNVICLADSLLDALPACAVCNGRIWFRWSATPEDDHLHSRCLANSHRTKDGLVAYRDDSGYEWVYWREGNLAHHSRCDFPDGSVANQVLTMNKGAVCLPKSPK